MAVSLPDTSSCKPHYTSMANSGAREASSSMQQPTVTRARGVEPGRGLRLPGQYIQYSGRHCQLVWQNNSWSVVDSSTNGTFVDGVKLEKHKPQPLTWGQEVRLSTTNEAPGGTPSYAMEFRLEVEDGKGDNYTSVNRSTTGSKRKASSNESTPEHKHGTGQYTSTVKRHAGSVPGQAMPVAAHQSTMHSPTRLDVPPQATRPSTSPKVLQQQLLHAALDAATVPGNRTADAVSFEQHSAIHQANKLLRQEKKELKAQLAAQQQAMETRLSELQASLLSSHKLELDKLRAQLGAQLEQSESIVSQQAAQLVELTRAVSDMQHLKAELQAMQTKLQHAEAEAQALRDEHASSQQQLKESRQQCNQLQHELGKAHDELQAAQQKEQAAVQQVSELKAQLAASGQLRDELEGLQDKEQEHREEFELQAALAQSLAREGAAAYQQLLKGLEVAYAAGPLLATMLSKMGQLYVRDGPSVPPNGVLMDAAATGTLNVEGPATANGHPASAIAQLAGTMLDSACRDTQQMATGPVPVSGVPAPGTLPVRRNLWASSPQAGGLGRTENDTMHASPAHTAGHVPTTQQATQQHLFADVAAQNTAPRIGAGPMPPPPAPTSSGMRIQPSDTATPAAGVILCGSLQQTQTGACVTAGACMHAPDQGMTTAEVTAAPTFQPQNGDQQVQQAGQEQEHVFQEGQAMDVDNAADQPRSLPLACAAALPAQPTTPVAASQQQAVELPAQTAAPAGPASPAQTSSAALRQRQLPRLRMTDSIATLKRRQLGLVSASQASCGQLPEESQQEQPEAGPMGDHQQERQEVQQQSAVAQDAGNSDDGDGQQQDADMQAEAQPYSDGRLVSLGPQHQASDGPTPLGISDGSTPAESQHARERNCDVKQSTPVSASAPNKPQLMLQGMGDVAPRDSYRPPNGLSYAGCDGPDNTTCEGQLD